MSIFVLVMKKTYPFLFALVLFLAAPCAMHAQRTYRIVEWNVENLFDIQHDEGHDDSEFLPEGSHHWTASRYWRKMNEIAKTLVDIGDTLGPPALVGLCEVENDSVLTYLTRRSTLRNVGYQYIMTNSPDHRGVDVALLYHPSLFRLITHYSIRIPSISHGLSPTRDILYASGRVLSGDTLHFLVCHLPSKTGGVKNSNKHRKLATQTIRTSVDSILTRSPQAKIIVMGDFNATPRERIFKQLTPPLRETLPTSRRELNRPIGTYYFQRLWSYLDHILISPSIHALGPAHEVRLTHLLDEEGHPNRTFKGPSYNGGISDHLPLILDIME